MTFDLPETLGRKFKKVVPTRRRSRLVANLLAGRLDQSGNSLVAACKKANTFKQISAEMSDWEQLNEAGD